MAFMEHHVGRSKVLQHAHSLLVQPMQLGKRLQGGVGLV